MGMPWKMQWTIYQDADEAIAAFTVAELGEMSPWEVGGRFLLSGKMKDGSWHVYYNANSLGFEVDKKIQINDMIADTEADARAKMLIYLLEQKLIAPNG